MHGVENLYCKKYKTVFYFLFVSFFYLGEIWLSLMFEPTRHKVHVKYIDFVAVWDY